MFYRRQSSFSAGIQKLSRQHRQGIPERGYIAPQAVACPTPSPGATNHEGAALLARRSGVTPKGESGGLHPIARAGACRRALQLA